MLSPLNFVILKIHKDLMHYSIFWISPSATQLQWVITSATWKPLSIFLSGLLPMTLLCCTIAKQNSYNDKRSKQNGNNNTYHINYIKYNEKDTFQIISKEYLPNVDKISAYFSFQYLFQFHSFALVDGGDDLYNG
jgi:hypothetical protein